MKYHLLLPPVVLALCGCHTDLYYQEQAVESARKFIYKHARELSAEQFAYVRLTPPVLLTGPVLSRNAENKVKDSLAGGEKMQICVTWYMPELETDYLVFGISEPGMAYWRPLKLIRRKIGKIDSSAQSAMNKARTYAINALYQQLTAAELNVVRFTIPELVQTSFELEKADEEPEQEKNNISVKDLFQYRHLVYGVIAIFVYVGVEIGIPGTLNFYLADPQSGAGLDPATAGTIAGFVAGTYWFLMLIGRFISSLISGKVSSKTQLTVTSATAIVFVIAAMFSTSVRTSMPVFTGSGFDMVQVPLTALLLVLCGLCTSVMWGTIFNLAVEGLGKKSAAASGLFMTMVIGGGILPLIQNAIADATSYMTSYWLLVAALAYICWFAVVGSKVKKA